jgi:hypothetical protein
VFGVQANEQVATEHGFDHFCQAATAQFFHRQHGQPRFEALLLQVFKGAVLLFGFGMNGVPKHAFESLTI